MIICQEAVAGAMKGLKPPQLTKKMLFEYVKAEYVVFFDYLNLIIDMKFNQRHGNMLSQ